MSSIVRQLPIMRSDLFTLARTIGNRSARVPMAIKGSKGRDDHNDRQAYAHARERELAYRFRRLLHVTDEHAIRKL